MRLLQISFSSRTARSCDVLNSHLRKAISDVCKLSTPSSSFNLWSENRWKCISKVYTWYILNKTYFLSMRDCIMLTAHFEKSRRVLQCGISLLPNQYAQTRYHYSLRKYQYFHVFNASNARQKLIHRPKRHTLVNLSCQQKMNL